MKQRKTPHKESAPRSSAGCLVPMGCQHLAEGHGALMSDAKFRRDSKPLPVDYKADTLPHDHHVSPLYSTYVRSSMLYGSETWAVKDDNLQTKKRADVRLMCGVEHRERKRTEEIRRWLRIEPLREVLRRGWLQWFGHVER